MLIVGDRNLHVFKLFMMGNKRIGIGSDDTTEEESQWCCDGGDSDSDDEVSEKKET